MPTIFGIDSISCITGWHSCAQLRSPVLVPNGLVNGNPSFLTPTESTYLNRSLKKLSQMITSTTSTAVQNLVEIRLWGLLGKWVKYNQIYLFIALFKQLNRSHRPPHFHGWWLKWHGLTQGCAFFGFGWYFSPFRGSTCPKTPILGAWIGIFQPNAKYWNVHIIKTTASIINKFCRIIDTP